MSEAGRPSDGLLPLLVIGGSAGSLPPLIELVAGLPADLPAAVLVCQHIGENVRSHLPEILERRGALPAASAVDGERLRAGRVFVAAPGHHLLVVGSRLRLSRTAPRVNRHRPSVDVLFASAAQTAGPATVAVVLSGVLDDGAVGAALVRRAGGEVFVQDPAAAEFAGMPEAALAAAEATILAADATGPRLIDAVVRAAARVVDRVHPGWSEVTNVDELPADPGFLQPGENRLTRLTCPECGGGLAQIDLPRITYFRCHVGHQYGPQTLAAAQNEASEQKLWSALAAIEEQAVVSNYLAGLATTGDDSADRLERERGRVIERRAAQLRELIHGWNAAIPELPAE